MQERSVLAIVDDDESVRDSTRDLLESAGFATATFTCAENVLGSALLSRVSCLITDMRMPGMTGIELHQHLVASNISVPTILMTGYPDERLRLFSRGATIVGYLVKPFAAEELLALVQLALEMGRTRRD